MLTFQKAPSVERHEKITSTQLRVLARAFNERIRSGVGDAAWRLAYLHYNAWRQVRNPDSSGFLFPAQGEFFDIYEVMEPESNTQWPDAGPGDFEGANLASPQMQFVFGNPVTDNEPQRLNGTVPLWINGSPPQSLFDFWQLGKDQRGVYDPISTAQFTPAFDAAASVFNFAFPFFSPHHKAYGGWQPIPLQLDSDCGNGDPFDLGIGIPSLQYFFTALRKDVSTSGFHGSVSTNADGYPVISYSGSCPCQSADFAAGHVQYLAELRFNYVVYVARGTSDCAVDKDYFPLRDWIIGPFTAGASLAHTDGKQISRAVHSYISDYRGTPEQRTPDTYKIKQIAYDYQEFFTRQYYLAPNKGVLSGAGIDAQYPQVTFTGEKINGGTYGSFGSEGSSHQYTDGFVLAGCFAIATNLFAPVIIEILDNTEVVAVLNLEPDENHDAQAMTWLKESVKPNPLRIRLGGQAVFVGTGSIVVECNELLEYKPEFQDAYLVDRMSSSKGGDPFLASGVDARGLDVDSAKQMSDNYLANGCIVNTQSDEVREQADWVNDSPVFDSARRMTKSHLRIIRRQQLTAYEVVDGKSVLYVKRFAFGLKNTRVDLLDGIAPPLDPIPQPSDPPDKRDATLIEDETYIVRGGSDHNANKVVYLGGNYFDGQTFKATTETKFGAHGDAQVFVYDGIKHEALKKGYTNEWVSFLQTKCYHANQTSIFKPEAYSDYFTWCNRCHFYSLNGSPKLNRFINYNNDVSLDTNYRPTLNPMRVIQSFLAPEAPSGYNYADGSNQITYGVATPEFRKSCQIYEAPFEIESAIVDDVEAGIVKLTFKERFRSHPNAPATVDKDPLAWSAGDIDLLRDVGGTGENWRTPDNAMREYFLSEVNGNYPCTFKTGDAGANQVPGGIEDNISGSCYPHVFLVKLIPSPYEDNNDTIQGHDSRCTVDAFQQMEVYLRAMCEGFVDGTASRDLVCLYSLTGINTMFDYTFEALCFEAFHGRDIGAFALRVRDDLPGFGPLPNTVMYADVFNRLASAVNLLDKARIDLPIRFRYRETVYQDTSPASPINCSGTSGCAKDGSTSFAYQDGGGGNASTYYSGGDVDLFATNFTALRTSQLDGCPFFFSNFQTKISAIVEINPDWVDAVPAPLLELVDTGQAGYIVRVIRTQGSAERRTITTTPGDGTGCCAADEWFDSAIPGNKFKWVSKPDIVETTCELFRSGLWEAPGLQSNDYRFGNKNCPPVSYCFNGPTSTTSVELLNSNGGFLSVPVVD